jgi:ATP-dependent exoDNAse (exonuclease V) beta subunit
MLDGGSTQQDPPYERADLLQNSGGAGRVLIIGPAGRNERLLGTMVHRLLQRFGLRDDINPSQLAEEVWRLVQPEEVADIRDRIAFEKDVICGYGALLRRPDVRQVYVSGEALHEVPFTMRLEGTIVRGTIDCLIRSTSGRVTILEFKTGRPRPEHVRQANLYRRAAEALFPGAEVETRLVYVAEANV